MATRDVRELANYINSIKDAVNKAEFKSMLILMSHIEGLAKRNAIKQFTGRNGRKLSGRLLNAISTRVDHTTGIGYLGTRSIPYGRTHEYGAHLTKPGNGRRKWFWIKQWGGAADDFRRMTPREFVTRMRADNRFKIIGTGSPGKAAVYQAVKDAEPITLFALAKEIKIPARPYLTPAIKEGLKLFPQIMNSRIKTEYLKL